MKYIVILGDGMADEPVDELSGKTPLEVANKPAIDYLTEYGELGMVKTVPEGIPPGSDAANLSVMGYNPAVFYSGRSPLEAISMGIPLAETDVTLRCNLVTLSDHEPYRAKTMIDYSSDEISSEEAAVLIKSVEEHLGTDRLHFHAGRSYRHLLVWNGGKTGNILTPPHDIPERPIAQYLPQGEAGALLLDLMERSAGLLRTHPVNVRRQRDGLRPATSVWLWGEGKRPALPNFEDKYGLKGSVISAVDLVLGIGLCAGLEAVDVPGATGNMHSNFDGKAQAAIEQLLKKGKDFVYLHVEAPDECGHRHEIMNKVKSIEIIDQQIVLPVKEALDASGEAYSVMVLPDHPTPLRRRTHTSDPVPYLIYRSTDAQRRPVTAYTEKNGIAAGRYITEGYTLMDRFIQTAKT
ncbi:MAG: cofactor-independent phosphoglycerate mutase [Bacteroidales bacterium]|nr:cofactor-independent phosphoglycerate mutase [Bacteroidales bacterium]